MINFEQTSRAEIGLLSWWWALARLMSIYRFVLRHPGGQVEELGFLPLPDDREAVAFGKTVGRELVQGAPTPHTGLVMVVTEDERPVGKIRVAAGRACRPSPGTRQQKRSVL